MHRLAIRRVEPATLTNAQVFRLGEILTDATYAPPWSLRWKAGAGDDLAGDETTSAYVRMLTQGPSADLFVYSREIEGQPEEWVGYILGGVFTEPLLHSTHMDFGIDTASVQRACPGHSTLFPVVGDYYWSVVMIQGETGWEDRPLECFRSKKVAGQKAFHHMVEMLVSAANRRGCPKHWVRTVTGQARVQKVAHDLGFADCGFQTVQQGETSATRVVMVKPHCGHAYSNAIIGDWE